MYKLSNDIMYNNIIHTSLYCSDFKENIKTSKKTLMKDNH